MKKQLLFIIILQMVCAVNATAQTPIRKEVLKIAQKMRNSEGVSAYYNSCSSYLYRSILINKMIETSYSCCSRLVEKWRLKPPKNAPPPMRENDTVNLTIPSKSRNFNLSIQLAETATTLELVTLLKHRKPVVKCYAFWELCSRYPSVPKDSLLKYYKSNMNDKRFIKCNFFPFIKPGHGNDKIGQYNKTGPCFYKSTVVEIFYNTLISRGQRWVEAYPPK